MSRLEETREKISECDKIASDLTDKTCEFLRRGIEIDLKIESQLALMSIASSLREINETLAIICDKLNKESSDEN